MKLKISDNFNYAKLMRFTLPSIIMMIITSIYVIVDGLFVANYVPESFAPLNIIYPFISMVSCFGFMLGTGGGALAGKTLGEGDSKKANEIFSLIIYSIIILGIIIASIGFIFMEQIAITLGAKPYMVEDCVVYGRILMITMPAFALQTTFHTFAVLSNKPNMGLIITILSGATNIILDFLFIVVFNWGIAGAALATGASQVIGGVIPLIYFFNKKNTSLLRLVKFVWDGKALLKSCINGSSELLTSISVSLVNILYNFQLLKYFDNDDGVNAYGIIMYIQFIFVAVFIGYTIGVSPIVSYNYGANNKEQLASIYKKSIIITSFYAVALTVIAEIASKPLASIFTADNVELLELSTFALRVYTLAFLISGYNIFASSFFTALNNGKISALISFMRTLVFQVASILLIPIIFGNSGIWFANVAAELLSFILVLYLLLKNGKRYSYL